MRDLELDYERERDYRAACLSDTYEEQPDRVTCRVPAPCSVPVTPLHYTAAVKRGCEDEYLNAMRARYGEGWD
jgi:hypothetical protein